MTFPENLDLRKILILISKGKTGMQHLGGACGEEAVFGQEAGPGPAMPAALQWQKCQLQLHARGRVHGQNIHTCMPARTSAP